MSSLDLYVSPGIMCAFDEEIRLIAQGYNGLVETVSNPIVIEVAQDGFIASLSNNKLHSYAELKGFVW
jgi:hypothetical protein